MISDKKLNDEYLGNKSISTKIAPKEYQQINKLVNEGLYLNSADFVREAIRNQLRNLNEITLRNISYEEQKEEITEYMKSHGEADALEIADALLLDVFEVNNILLELQKEGKIKEV